MNLIAISDDTLINPDKVSTIEIKRRKDQMPTVVVTVDGKTLQVEKQKEFIDAMLRSGMNLSKQFFSI